MPGQARTHQLQRSLIYHIYSRSNNRQTIFSETEDFEYFKRLLQDYIARFRITIYHWVIMSNHYHLVIESDMPETISKLMAGLHRSYTYYHHRIHETTGFLWQGRFKMQPIQKELYLIACGRYVERNPVRAGMVEEPLEYRHSSARYYCLGEIDNITTTNEFFTGLHQDYSERQRQYRSFLQTFDHELDKYFNQLDSPCGKEEFRKRLVVKNGHLLPRRKGRN